MTATTEPATEPAAEPYPDVATQVRDELRRAWLRVEYQIRLAWQRESSSRRTDEVTGPTEIGHLFSLARGEPTTAAVADDASGADTVLEQWLAQHYHTEQRTLASARASRRSPLVDLRVTFELTPRQWSLLMFALLPELDPNLDQAYRYLSRDPSCRGLDARLLAQLVYDKPQTRSLMARDPSPRSPLLHYRLLEITAGETLMYRRIRAATRLVYMLDGDQLELDPELGDVAELRRGAVAGVFPAATIERATAAMRSTDVVLTIQGQRGLGKRLLLQHAAAHWGRALIVIDAKRFAQQPAPTQAQTVHALLRELELLDALPVFAELDDAQTGDDRDATPPCFDMFLDEWRGPVAITVRGERVPRIHQRPIVDIALEVPSRDDRVTLWRGEMPSLTADDADGLASRFAIPGGVIVAAVQAAQAGRMPDDGPPGAGQLDSAVAAQLHQRISRLGKKLPTPYDLDDLIVDRDTRAAVLEIAAAAKGRRKIRDHFELRGAAGISVLFSGHPGVGKTMSGTVLARQLGLDIYEIDLSQVVSKWLGETEKNLSDVFDAAEPGHVVLLFNEADSLFGKRTADVKSSNDRYANLETNYLLQRLERFNGLAILTTNLTSSIDQAFKRRFAYDVFFSFPSPDMRAELWRRTLPKRSRSASIDYDALADKYELTGGFIKVACERAAYVAGARGTEIDEKLLRATVERMYRERGKLSAVGPLE